MTLASGRHAMNAKRSAINQPEITEAPTVYVVDDDVAVREMLAPLIRSAGWQPRMAASAEEFLARSQAVAPSCLLTELNLPGMTGLDLQKLVVARRELPVIFMGACPDVRAAVQAMKGGALEVLSKPMVPGVLVSTIRQGIELSRVALGQIARIQAFEQRYASLSAREREVMSLVTAGRLNKQVGGELGISEIKVKVHRGGLMRKMQARSFAELVSMVVSLRSIDAMTLSSGIPL